MLEKSADVTFIAHLPCTELGIVLCAVKKEEEFIKENDRGWAAVLYQVVEKSSLTEMLC